MNMLLEKLKPYMGAPYKWSLDGMPADGPGGGFWFQEEVPKPEDVHREGCNCVGLLNIIMGLLESPLRFRGTSDVWNRFGSLSLPIVLEGDTAGCQSSALDGIPPMSLLIGDYVDETKQGHVALVLEGGEILHCYVDESVPKEGLYGPGICIEPTWKVSHAWWQGGVYHGWVPLRILWNP